MRNKILVGVLSVLILAGTNFFTWKAKTFIDNYNLHPIEREFKKLPRALRLMVMVITLQEVNRSKKKQGFKI